MMTFQVLFFAILVGIVSCDTLRFNPRVVEASQSAGKWPPKFCNRLDCPIYKVIESTKVYELREYFASRWVTTNIAGMDYKEASSKDFMRLFDYISGKNTKGEKIDMTAPVLIQVIPGQSQECESNFTMSFYIAPKVKSPPLPSDSAVFLSKLPTLKAYVRSFGGYVTDIKDWIKEAKILADSIKDTSKYHTSFYYTAGYNSPFQFLNRHNEIWFIAK